MRSDGEWSMSESIVLCVNLIPPTRVNVGVILCAFIREEMGEKRGKRRMLVIRFNSPHEKACCEEK